MIPTLDFLLALIKPQTIPSAIYSVIFFLTSSTFLGISSYIASNERFTFSCRGISDKYYKDFCLKQYNSGPNVLQSWLYLVNFLFSVSLLLIGSFIITKLIRNLKGNGHCNLHIHHFYFGRLVLTILFHLSLVVILSVKYGYGPHEIRMKGTYLCLNGNSTLHCIDTKAETKSKINSACFWFQIIFAGWNGVELLYYLIKWKCTKKCEREGSSNQTNGCQICRSFVEISALSGMLSLMEILQLFILSRVILWAKCTSA